MERTALLCEQIANENEDFEQRRRRALNAVLILSMFALVLGVMLTKPALECACGVGHPAKRSETKKQQTARVGNGDAMRAPLLGGGGAAPSSWV